MVNVPPFSKVLISGASGFVGVFLLQKLAELEIDSVIALHYSELSEDARQQFSQKFKWTQADITSDDLTKAVEGVDTVFHLAAYSSVSEAEADRQLMAQVNVVGTRRLAEACKAAGVRHFIFVSSIAACETGPLPDINETNGYPVSTYGKTKKEAEDTLLALAGSGFEVTVLRATALFGEHHRGSVFELVKMIQKGRFAIFGTGDNRTNFYYVRDFVDVLIAVSHNPRAYGRVFIAADTPCSLQELVSFITRALGGKRTIPRVPNFVGKTIAGLCDVVSALTGKSLPLSRRRYEAMVRDVVYSNQELKALDIRPAYGFEEGLKRTIQWYRDAGLL